MYGQDSKLMLEGTELEQRKAIRLPSLLLMGKGFCFGDPQLRIYKNPLGSKDNPIKFQVDHIEFDDDSITLGFNPLPLIGQDSLLHGDEEELEELAARQAMMNYCLKSALDGFNFIMLENGKPVKRS
jgi:hypothetical protein